MEGFDDFVAGRDRIPIADIEAAKIPRRLAGRELAARGYMRNHNEYVRMYNGPYLPYTRPERASLDLIHDLVADHEEWEYGVSFARLKHALGMHVLRRDVNDAMARLGFIWLKYKYMWVKIQIKE